MRVLLTGGGGLLGGAIRAAWPIARPKDALIAPDRTAVDLRDAEAVGALVRELRPDAIVHAAAVIGGIADKASAPTAYLLDNIRMDGAVFAAAIAARVPELLYVGSAAAYPADAEQPLVPSALGTGPMEAENEPYGLAKLAGIRLCEYASREHGLAYRAVLPCNLYGPTARAGRGHLVEAVLRRCAEAARNGVREVVVWGDGRSRRELLYAPDLADWIIAAVGDLASLPTVLNLGAGEDIDMDSLYAAAGRVAGFTGRFVHDRSRPNGVRARLLDSSDAARLGWRPTTTLLDGMTHCFAALPGTTDESTT